MNKSKCLSRKVGDELGLLRPHILIVCDVLGRFVKDYWNIARIARDPLVQRCVDGVDIFRGIFDFREASLVCARVMSQSLYHKIMYSLSAIYDHRIQSNSLLLVKLHCFSHLLSLWKSPSN